MTKPTAHPARTRMDPSPAILCVAYKYFDSDPRIIREVNALLDRGYLVDMICPRPPRGEYACPPGLRFHCITMDRRRGSRARYLLEYLHFFTFAVLASAALYLRRRHPVVQVFVMPEVLMLAGVLPKLLGARLLMDWEDPSREMYLTKYGVRSSRSLTIRLIELVERIAVGLADEVITPNEGFRSTFVARGYRRDRIAIVPNAPDRRVFREREEGAAPAGTGEFLLLFHGTLVERCGIHLAIHALPSVRAEIPNARLLVVGEGEADYLERCRKLVTMLGLEDAVTFAGRLPITRIPELIHRASVGVIPNLRTAFEIAFPQKALEFSLLRVPLAMSRLTGHQEYFAEDEAFYFEPGDAGELARRIVELHHDPEEARRRAERSLRRCRALEWESSYLAAVERLVGSRARPARQVVAPS